MLCAGADRSITRDDTDLRMTVTYHTYTDNETVTVDTALVGLLCCVCVDTVHSLALPASHEARERSSVAKSADAVAAEHADVEMS